MSTNGSKCNITAILPHPCAARRVVLAGRFKLATNVAECGHCPTFGTKANSRFGTALGTAWLF